MKKELGAENFFAEFFSDNINDFSWANLQASLVKESHAAPATEKEVHRKQADELEAQERRQAAGSSGVGTSTVPFALTPSAASKVDDLKAGKAQSVQLFLDPATEAIELHSAPSATAASLGSTITGDKPLYVLFSLDHAGAKHLVLVYYCPEKAPVRHKMLASTGKAALLRGLSDRGYPVVKSIEVSEGNEVNENDLRAEVESATATVTAGDAPSVTRVSRPTRPGKGGARLNTATKN